VNVKDVRAFWSTEPDDEGFDPVKYPEIKPYITASREDDELGLRHLLEWPELIDPAAESRGRSRRHGRPRSRPVRSTRRSWS
jgi:hypothetical protein